jgi:hypothetical protein
MRIAADHTKHTVGVQAIDHRASLPIGPHGLLTGAVRMRATAVVRELA